MNWKRAELHLCKQTSLYIHIVYLMSVSFVRVSYKHTKSCVVSKKIKIRKVVSGSISRTVTSTSKVINHNLSRTYFLSGVTRTIKLVSWRFTWLQFCFVRSHPDHIKLTREGSGKSTTLSPRQPLSCVF